MCATMPAWSYGSRNPTFAYTRRPRNHARPARTAGGRVAAYEARSLSGWRQASRSCCTPNSSGTPGPSAAMLGRHLMETILRRSAQGCAGPHAEGHNGDHEQAHGRFSRLRGNKAARNGFCLRSARDCVASVVNMSSSAKCRRRGSKPMIAASGSRSEVAFLFGTPQACFGR